MRRFLTAGAAVLLVITGLVAGPGVPGAKASKLYCRDGWPPGLGTLEVVNTGVYLAVETYAGTNDFLVGACYSDTPVTSPAFLVGGFVGVRVYQSGPDTWNIRPECAGDTSPTTLITVNCTAMTSVTTTVTTAPTVSVTGSGWTYLNGSTLTLGATGVNGGALTPTAGANPSLVYNGTCATVHGVTLVPCSTDALDTSVAPGDAPDVLTGGTTSTCLLTVGSTCYLYAPQAAIQAFDDSSNATNVKVLGAGFSDPGRICLGFGC
jgi:hypothetical protein